MVEVSALVSSAALSDHAEEVSLQSWKDEMGRLRIWSANIGAHQRGQSSLDFHLRDASHIRRLEDLLNDLKEVLEEDSDDEASENVETPSDDDTTEIQQLHKDIVETIHHLYRISPRPTLGTNKLDAQPFKHWAHNHASNKYPLADAGVLECVSSAMALQRAILKYRERHHAKLSQNVDDGNEGDRRSTLLSETIVTDICHDLPPDSNDYFSVVDTSETKTSYAGTLINGTGATIIPPLPKEGAGKTPFECPYCFLIISVRDTRAWARHIFRDLMPYVCIFPGCSGKLYESRRQWYAHVENAHGDSMSFPKFVCPICKDSFSTAMYERHLSRHLEELALFLLPRPVDKEDSDEDTDEESERAMSNELRQKSYDGQAPHIVRQLLESDNPPAFETLPQNEPFGNIGDGSREAEEPEHWLGRPNLPWLDDAPYIAPDIDSDGAEESDDDEPIMSSRERSGHDQLILKYGGIFHTVDISEFSIDDGSFNVGKTKRTGQIAIQRVHAER
ncbi:hypothetical protein N7460_011340 [Penicillium canescens]|uniref:C2H2-type domain-containing protein n=1 Tax=Penicillium canescens TaxID=5083 RepID=A0AAD6I195_PENCN|nr:hypothetical protein N7460_011340 [Penicillium canescens]KAJ6039807.1 hypothetical protein N7444_008712 [Penicillium canescens]